MTKKEMVMQVQNNGLKFVKKDVFGKVVTHIFIRVNQDQTSVSTAIGHENITLVRCDANDCITDSVHLSSLSCTLKPKTIQMFFDRWVEG